MNEFESNFNISIVSKSIPNEDFSLKEFKEGFTANYEVYDLKNKEIKFKESCFKSEEIEEGFISNEKLNINYGDNVISRSRRINRNRLNK
ncbi:hypothetical protein E0494_02930 [Marinilabiliaceae bacterium JC040]|nr:hypothetical protein [Marinilabiliaceae bacterium JC040]